MMGVVRIGRRKYQRVKMVAPVRLRLAGSRDLQFEFAHTLDATASGVRLAGYRGELNVGDIIEIQYGRQRALFKVIWIHSLERASEKHLGAECIEPDANIWGTDFPMEPDEYQEPE